MKKRILASILSLCLLAPSGLMYARGGDSFAGGLAGGMVGGLFSGALNKDRSGRKAEQKVDALAREQQYDRYISQKMSFYGLIIFLIIMFVAMGIMGYLILKRKNNK